MSEKKAKRSRLIERVRKLYAMSHQNEQSPHEAEAALRNCMKLMGRHGITAADLETSEFGSAQIVRGAMTDLVYVQFIASAAGTLHDCLPVFRSGESMEMRGHDIDVTVAKLTFNYIMDAMQSAEALHIGPGKHLEATASNKLQWRTGFAESIVNRAQAIVRQRKAQQEAEAGTGKSLTVRKMDAVMNNCAEGVDVTNRTADYQAPNSDATLLGGIAGSNVSLNTQISDKRS